MNDAKRVTILRKAIDRADRMLDWILNDERYPEDMRTTAMRVRRIMDAAMDKTKGEPLTAADRSAPIADELPKVKLDIPAMMASGVLTEARR